MSSNEENQTAIIKQERTEEGDENDDDEEEEYEEDLNSISPSTSSDDPNKFSSTIAAAAASETPLILTPTPIAAVPPPKGSATETPPAFTDSRKLFQRLWTDEDEIGLLQGFLDFTTQRGALKSSYHHETGPFYDQIKTRLQLDFNKSQLVEKLRRLKKKYRNAVARVDSGKELSFKTPHDQATYEISRKIWGNGNIGLDDAGVEDDESNRPPTSNLNSDVNNNNGVAADVSNNSDKKVSSTPRRRSQKRPAEDDLSNLSAGYQTNSSISSVIEDTVRSCLSPLMKELLHCATNGNGSWNLGGGGGGRLLGGVALNPLHLNFGGNSMMNFSSGEMIDEKWRKQQILELEVYSKRIELVQEQIKSALEELRSMGS